MSVSFQVSKTANSAFKTSQLSGHHLKVTIRCFVKTLVSSMFRPHSLDRRILSDIWMRCCVVWMQLVRIVLTAEPYTVLYIVVYVKFLRQSTAISASSV
jgi:hypothetical protein